MLVSQNKINKNGQEIRVLKFGGSSVKDVGRIHHVVDIIESRLREGPLLIVVSAMGDTTDWLLNLAGRCTADEPDSRELDQLLATGEQVSIALVALVLKSRGIRAKSLTGAQAGITTDGTHNNARVVDIGGEELHRAFEEHDVVVVAGFQGTNAKGDTTTLGRGGSDTSAVALAVACQAVSCDIYTDVDGILTADPRVIGDAILLREISSEDAVEMARLGAQVIHPRAVELARNYRIPLRVRNTFKPGHVGTIIQGEEEMENYRCVTGVAIDRGNAIICVNRLSGRVDAISKILGLVSSFNIGVDLINQNLQTSDSVSFTVAQADLAKTVRVLDSLSVDYPGIEVSFDPDATKVSLIGSGIATSVSIAATAFGVIGKAGINVKLAATSDRRLTVVVSADHAEHAARSLHRAFDLGHSAYGLQKTS